MQKQDQDFLARVAAGHPVAADGEVLRCAGAAVPGDYRSELLRLMVVFADSELAGAAGFCPFINRGPGLRERIVAARIVAEKYAHAEIALELLKPFGVDPRLYVQSHAWDARLDRTIDLGTRRIGGDKRLNVFHYPLLGWDDAVVFHLLMGAATTIQLAEMIQSSYAPLAAAIIEILPRETEHARLAERGVEQAMQRSGGPVAIQAAADYWYPRVAATFGRVDSEHAATYIQYGLRRRSSAQMLNDWQARATAALQGLGIAVPA